MAKRIRRTSEQVIADLEARITSIRARAERKKAMANPAVRHIRVAIKAIDKAIVATTDATMRTALQEARTTLSACVAIEGIGISSSAAETTKVRRKRRVKIVEPE